MSESAANVPADAGSFPMPPATFEFLVFSLKSQADMALGLLPFGDANEKAEVNLPYARHFIDLLGVVEEKTRGNLSLEEKRLIENSLTELRFRYLQASANANSQS